MVEKKRQEEKSLYEKSMQLTVNIIKHSSFSLATMNLGDKRYSDNGPIGLIPIKSFTSYPSNSDQMSKSKRSQAPLRKSYLMEGDHHYNLSPSSRFMILENEDDSIDDGNFSDYIKRFHTRTKNEVNTDGKASAYIRKFHEKNSRDYTLASSTSLPLVLPPAPPSIKK